MLWHVKDGDHGGAGSLPTLKIDDVKVKRPVLKSSVLRIPALLTGSGLSTLSVVDMAAAGDPSGVGLRALHAEEMGTLFVNSQYLKSIKSVELIIIQAHHHMETEPKSIT